MKATLKLDAKKIHNHEWPFDLSAYDRSYELRSEEVEAIEVGLKRRAGRNQQWLLLLRPYIQRLIRPIEDILDFIGVYDILHRTGIISALIREMYSHNSSFWAWTDVEWMEFLGLNYQNFWERFRCASIRQPLMAFSYIVGNTAEVSKYGIINPHVLAAYLFGSSIVDKLIEKICREMQRIGYTETISRKRIPLALCQVILANRSPYLEDLTAGVLERVRETCISKTTKEDMVALSRALASLGIIGKPIAPRIGARKPTDDALIGVHPEWLTWCQRWRDTSTLSEVTRRSHYYALLKVGRWILQVHPEYADPSTWKHETAAEYVAALGRVSGGDWSVVNRAHKFIRGKPLSAATQAGDLAAMRAFFRDCQEWNWIPRRFNPARTLQTPRTVRRKIGPNPRVIADNIWAKLLWAGLNLTEEDLPK